MSSYEEIVVDREVENAWRVFRDRLTEHLIENQDEELALGLDGNDSDPEVTISRWQGKWAVCVPDFEMVSAQYNVRDDMKSSLRQFGFDEVCGDWVFSADLRFVDQAVQAVLMILRGCWGVLLPSGLWASEPSLIGEPAQSGRSGAGASASPVIPEVVHPDTTSDLKAWVNLVLTEQLGHAPRYDKSGDIPIRNRRGSSVVSFRAGGHRLEVWTMLAEQVRFKKAHKALDRLARKYPDVRFFLDQDTLIASVVLEVRPFVPAHLDAAIRRVCHLSVVERELALSLRRRRAAVTDTDVDVDLGMLFASIWAKGVDADDLASQLSGGNVSILRTWETVARRMADRHKSTDEMPDSERAACRLAQAKWERVERVSCRVRLAAEATSSS